MHKSEMISCECDNLMMAPCHKAIQSFNGQAFGLSTRDRFPILMDRTVASVIANKEIDMTDSNAQKPTLKLSQEKAYYAVDASGNRTRKTKTVDVAVGYENVSKNGNAYTRYTLHPGDITADVDGVVKLVGFTLNNN